MRNTAILVSILLFLFCCSNLSPSNPSDKEIIKAYEDWSQHWGDGGWKVVSFKKTNGVAKEMNGVKAYSIFYCGG
jgi:hypothetical protein